MGDWSKPVLGDAYANFLQEVIDIVTDSATQFNSAPTNQPDHVIRFLRSPGKFQEWLSAAWNDLLLDVTGDAAGLIAGVGVAPSAALATGTPSSSTVLFGDQTWKNKAIPFVYLAKSANYTVTAADVQAKTILLLTNAIIITLPDTQGTGANLIDGLEIGAVNKGTSVLVFAAHSGDTILGGSAWTFDFGQYSSVSLRCNKTAGTWEVF